MTKPPSLIALDWGTSSLRAYLMAAESREKLKEQEKAFGADPQFKDGYAASNKKHG